MRPITLLVILDDEGLCDPHAAEEAARARFPDVPIDRVIPLEELRLGAWLHAHRAKRCRTAADVLRTPERQQSVVVDIDL
ncbi:hypothetical protein [Botrimarina mediterranea]|uniref:Uncharacterized protein n=1 Tax=Botrimarina mediterranea TaxID=2528022 RepID=A0A518K5C2_9BACT|nr:hypothetical protein [Botrimarina mediterranea]QDV72975.1 hypothetical protein Spa11_11620 [Botrimarina mediterranea]QDV77549.1 hypothetical protein K2D_11450 [Planctomycetes bacterium K2D]